MKVLPGVFLASVIAALLGGEARADQLDKQMHDHLIPGVIGKLKRYRTIGVLRFRVQEHGGKENFSAPLCGQLAERVSNLLILHGGNRSRPFFGVIRDPGLIAQQKGIRAWYSNPQSRDDLFELTYPLAWGKSQAQADAFLTGKLSLNRDRTQATLLLQAFDRIDPSELRTLGKIEFDTDLSLLRDLGIGFSLSQETREAVAQTRSGIKRSRIILAEVSQQHQRRRSDDLPPTDGAQPSPALKPSNIGGVALEVLVDNKAQTVRENTAGGDSVRWQMDSPLPGNKIAFRLKNTTREKRAVVLRLNGINTLNQQKSEQAATAMKWVLPPGKTYTIDGFYLLTLSEDKEENQGAQDRTQPAKKPQVIPFGILVGAEASKAREELGDKAGLIQVDVFEEGKQEADNDNSAVMLFTARGLSPREHRQSAVSYQALREALLRSGRLTTRVITEEKDSVSTSREIIVPDEKKIRIATENLKETHFRNPSPVGSLDIRVRPNVQPPRPGQGDD